MGLTDDESLKSVALRLSRLHNKLTDDERNEFANVAGGHHVSDIIRDLRQATDPGFQLQAAQAETGNDEPTGEELAAARERLVQRAVGQLRRGEVRQKLEDLQRGVSEILIHLGGHDALVEAGFTESPLEARSILETWQEFIEDHHDEYIALNGRTTPARTAGDRALRTLCGSRTPSPGRRSISHRSRLWAAYETLDADKVKGHGGKLDADLVRVIRYTLKADGELVPHAEIVKQRFDWWLMNSRRQGGTSAPNRNAGYEWSRTTSQRHELQPRGLRLPALQPRRRRHRGLPALRR